MQHKEAPDIAGMVDELLRRELAAGAAAVRLRAQCAPPKGGARTVAPRGPDGDLSTMTLRLRERPGALPELDHDERRRLGMWALAAAACEWAPYWSVVAEGLDGTGAYVAGLRVSSSCAAWARLRESCAVRLAHPLPMPKTDTKCPDIDSQAERKLNTRAEEQTMGTTTTTAPGRAAVEDELGQVEAAALFGATGAARTVGPAPDLDPREVAIREGAREGVSALVVGRLATMSEAQSADQRLTIKELVEHSKRQMDLIEKQNATIMALADKVGSAGQAANLEAFKLAAGIATAKSELPAELVGMLVSSQITGADYRVEAERAKAEAEAAKTAKPKSEAEIQADLFREALDIIKSAASGKPTEGALSGFVKLLGSNDPRAKKAINAVYSKLSDDEKQNVAAALMGLFAS